MGDRGASRAEFPLKNHQTASSRKGDRIRDEKSFHVIPLLHVLVIYICKLLTELFVIEYKALVSLKFCGGHTLMLGA